MVGQSRSTSKGRRLRDRCGHRILQGRMATERQGSSGSMGDLANAESGRPVKSHPHRCSANRTIWPRFRRNDSGLRVIYATRKSAINGQSELERETPAAEIRVASVPYLSLITDHFTARPRGQVWKNVIGLVRQEADGPIGEQPIGTARMLAPKVVRIAVGVFVGPVISGKYCWHGMGG